MFENNTGLRRRSQNEKKMKTSKRTSRKLVKKRDRSPRHTQELKNKKIKGRSTTIKGTQIQTKNSSTKPTQIR